MFDRLKYHWGPEAIWCAFAMHSEMKHMGSLIEETYLPVLRLVYEDPDRVEREYQAVRAQRKLVKRWDSPRTRWAKTYGNFVRELEWACGQLKPRLSEPDFEALIVYTITSRMEKWVGWMKPLMERADQRTPGGLNAAMRGSGMQNSATFIGMTAPIVGDVELRSAEDGVIELYIPDCAMHTVVSDTEPQTNACLYGCKAACEAFMGPDDVMSIHFEPNLPAFDCIMTISVRESRGDKTPEEPVDRELMSA